MKEMDISNALSQLRLNAGTNQIPNLNENANPTVDFAQLLKNSIDSVNDLQQQSSKLGTSFELGDPSISLAEVMIAKQKAGIAFQSALQVRNKIIGAYKEIMAMQV